MSSCDKTKSRQLGRLFLGKMSLEDFERSDNCKNRNHLIISAGRMDGGDLIVSVDVQSTVDSNRLELVNLVLAQPYTICDELHAITPNHQLMSLLYNRLFHLWKTLSKKVGKNILTIVAIYLILESERKKKNG